MKRLSVILLLCLFSTTILADNGLGLSNSIAKKKRGRKFDKSKLFVGGGLGGGSLPFGNGYFISASPTVGYQFTDRLHAGFSFGANYFRKKELYNNFNTNATEKYVESGLHYSPSLFARYFVLDFLFLQIRPEYNSFKVYDQPTANFSTGKYETNIRRLNIPSALAGVGYAQRLGGSSYMMVSVMYDLVQNPNSPYYRQPIFGGGLALGLFGR